MVTSYVDVIQEKINGEMEVTRRRGRRRKTLLDDLKDRRGYSHLKEEALDRTMWRQRFGGGFGPVVRQNTEWMNIEFRPKRAILCTFCFSSLLIMLPGNGIILLTFSRIQLQSRFITFKNVNCCQLIWPNKAEVSIEINWNLSSIKLMEKQYKDDELIPALNERKINERIV